MDITTTTAIVTAADGADTTLVFKTNQPFVGPTAYAQIKVVSGTFQFNVGASADNALCPLYTSSDDVPLIPFEIGINSAKNLHFHAANAAETFRITVV
jgi:hypothetical protein